MPSLSIVNRLLINRNFALLWSGQTVSYLGDAIFTTTLILWIATRVAQGQSWAPLAVSGVLLATAVATSVVGPLAGVYVDRWDKRRTLLSMNALRAFLVALLLPLAFVPSGTLPALWELGWIYTIVILTTSCDQFFSPARLALIGDIVPEEQRARATGTEQASQQLAFIIGAPLAAPLFFIFGVQWALIGDALSFGVSFLTLLAIRTPPSARSLAPGDRGNALGEFRAGLHFFASNRVLRTILIAAVVGTLGAGATNALNIFFLQENLHAPAQLYGVMGAATASGALLGAIVAGIWAQRIGLVRCFWLGLVLSGLLFLVYARMTTFVTGVAVATFEQVPDAAISVVFAPLVLQATPRELVGRVFAVFMPSVSLTSMLSIALAGYLDSTVLGGLHVQLVGVSFGPVDTIFTVSGCLMVLAGLYAMVALRLPAPNAEPALGASPIGSG
jgi:MFS family permease